MISEKRRPYCAGKDRRPRLRNFIDQGPFLAHLYTAMEESNHSRARFLTWLPKTPIEQAEDTWSGPNHTAATFGDTPKRKTWAVADIAWPINAILNPSRDTLRTFIHAPAVVPIDPRRSVTRKPFFNEIKRIAFGNYLANITHLSMIHAPGKMRGM